MLYVFTNIPLVWTGNGIWLGKNISIFRDTKGCVRTFFWRNIFWGNILVNASEKPTRIKTVRIDKHFMANVIKLSTDNTF